MIIKLENQEIPAHKFILSARTDFFNEATLSEVTILGKALKYKQKCIKKSYMYIDIIRNTFSRLDLFGA